MGFPRQGYWSGLPFPSLGDLPGPGIKLRSPALAGRFPLSQQGVQLIVLYIVSSRDRSSYCGHVRVLREASHRMSRNSVFFLHLLRESKIISQLENGIKQRSVVLKYETYEPKAKVIEPEISSWVELVNLNCSLLNPNKGQFSISYVFFALAEASGNEQIQLWKLLKIERWMKTKSNQNTEGKEILNDWYTIQPEKM